MNKEKLLEMGFTEEQAKNVLKLHKETLDGNYIPKDRFNEVEEQVKTLKATSAEKDKQIKELGKFKGTAEELEAKAAELEKANKQLETGHKAALAKLKKENAIKQHVLEEAHDPDMVMSLIDIDKVDIGEDGKIRSGFKEQFETVKKDKPFLFKDPNAKPEPKPQFTPKGGKPGEGNPEGNPDGKGKDEAVNLAKSLAGGQTGNSDAVQKADTYYFGTPALVKK